MFRFFRKYQRYFFIVITIVVVVTFSFFGTYNLTSKKGEKKIDKKICPSLGKEFLTESEIKLMSHFLSSGCDTLMISSSMPPNLLNDGVITKDLLKTGIIYDLVKPSLPHITAHCRKVVNLSKSFTLSFNSDEKPLCIQTVWKELAPQIPHLCKKLAQQNIPPEKTFKSMVKLFLAQESFPQSELKKALFLKHSKDEAAYLDEGIFQEDFSLFGFHNLKDWFGENVIDLASEFILNVAYLAQKDEYDISFEEAKWDLFQSFQKNLKAKLTRKNLSDQDIVKAYQAQIFDLHLSEKDVVELWRKILLFRQYFKTFSNAVLMDNFTFQDFFAFAQKGLEIDQYTLPSYLQLKNTDDLVSLELYLQATTPMKNSSSLDLPHTYLPVAEVEKVRPELVEERYSVQMASLSSEEIGKNIGEKKLWEWQLKEENWSRIIQTFPALQRKETLTAEQRFKKLESLPLFERAKIDLFSRHLMIKEDPSIVSSSFVSIKKEPMILSFCHRGNTVNLPFSKGKELKKLLDTSWKNGKDGISPITYTEDDELFFSFDLIDKAKEKNIISYKDAMERKIFAPLVQSFLKQSYENMQNLFLDEMQQPKPFHQVKEEVAKKVFADLLRAIENSRKLLPTNGKEGSPVKFRLATFVEKQLKAYQTDANHLSFSTADSLVVDLSKQWDMMKVSKKIFRDDPKNRFKDVFFAKQITPPAFLLLLDEEGYPCFVHVKTKIKNNEKSIKAPMKRCQRVLLQDAQAIVGQQLVERMYKKKCLQLPVE